MGALNGQTNGDASKQNGARSNLVSVASRLEKGRALAQDVWSIFKYVGGRCVILCVRAMTDFVILFATVLPICLLIALTSDRDT